MEDVAIKAARENWERLKHDIDSLKNRIAGDEAVLMRKQAEAAGLDEWIAKWYELAGHPIPPTAAERMETQDNTERAARPKNPKRKDVALAAVEYIRENRAPLTRREIFDRLKLNGIVIQGKDPEMVLSTMLWRESDIIRRLPGPGGGYWPADVPYPLDDVKIDL